jgi:hypothetical protein
MTPEPIRTLDIDSWTPSLGEAASAALSRDLEQGGVLFMPRLDFELLASEERFLSERWGSGAAKNISVRAGAGEVRGAHGDADELAALHAMVTRYARSADTLLDGMFPRYAPHRRPGSTSFRPARIEGRWSSWRRDDTRMHIDSFPSNPVQGRRILRVFSNVHPEGVARDWLIGEPFAQFARRFVPRARRALPGASAALAALGITKSRRSAYDHLMLQLHDFAKGDADFQRDAPRLEFAFPAGSSWVAFSDQVVHAATAGQFAFEQTSYLSIEGLADRASSPLAVLERLTGRVLV